MTTETKGSVDFSLKPKFKERQRQSTNKEVAEEWKEEQEMTEEIDKSEGSDTIEVVSVFIQETDSYQSYMILDRLEIGDRVYIVATLFGDENLIFDGEELEDKYFRESKDPKGNRFFTKPDQTEIEAINDFFEQQEEDFRERSDCGGVENVYSIFDIKPKKRE